MRTSSMLVYGVGYGPEDVSVRELSIGGKVQGYYATTPQWQGRCHSGADLHPTVEAALECHQQRRNRRCDVCGELTGQEWARLCLPHWRAAHGVPAARKRQPGSLGRAGRAAAGLDQARGDAQSV